MTHTELFPVSYGINMTIQQVFVLRKILVTAHNFWWQEEKGINDSVLSFHCYIPENGYREFLEDPDWCRGTHLLKLECDDNLKVDGEDYCLIGIRSCKLSNNDCDGDEYICTFTCNLYSKEDILFDCPDDKFKLSEYTQSAFTQTYPVSIFGVATRNCGVVMDISSLSEATKALSMKQTYSSTDQLQQNGLVVLLPLQYPKASNEETEQAIDDLCKGVYNVTIEDSRVTIKAFSPNSHQIEFLQNMSTFAGSEFLFATTNAQNYSIDNAKLIVVDSHGSSTVIDNSVDDAVLHYTVSLPCLYYESDMITETIEYHIRSWVKSTAQNENNSDQS